MGDEARQGYYVSLKHDGGVFPSIRVHRDKSAASHPENKFTASDDPIRKPTSFFVFSQSLSEFDRGFEILLADFKRSVLLYHTVFALESFKLAKTAYEKTLQDLLGFITGGEPVEATAEENVHTYFLRDETAPDFRHLVEKLSFSEASITHMLPIFIVGLISEYDAFLAKLLSHVFAHHPQSILTPDKTITLEQLASFENVDQARQSIIDREIDICMRKSHLEQVQWIDKKLNTTLEGRLKTMLPFIEICERRNLFTHTGGVVSPEYIRAAKAHPGFFPEVEIGQHIGLELSYFADAIGTVLETGTQILYFLWRKFSMPKYELCDDVIGDFCLDLIRLQRPRSAENILLFVDQAMKQKKGTESRRLTNLINLSNAMKLRGAKLDDFKKPLLEEDWTATRNEFQVCVSAVLDDRERLFALMRASGQNGPINLSNYRNWPVFSSYQGDSDFEKVLEIVFGKSSAEAEMASMTIENSLLLVTGDNDDKRSDQAEIFGSTDHIS